MAKTEASHEKGKIDPSYRTNFDRAEKTEAKDLQEAKET